MQTLNQQIKQNQRRTMFSMLGFLVLVALIGFLIGMIFANQDGYVDINVALKWMGGFLLAALLYSTWVYFSVTNILMKSSNAKKLTPDDDKQLFNIISDLAMVANLPMPDVYLIEDASPNAFATGRDPKHSAVAVTSGLRNLMNREELEGVLAHELSHIKNYDIRVSSITVALTTFIAGAGVFLMIAGSSMMRNSSFLGFASAGSRDDDDDRSAASIMMAIMAFGLIIWIGGLLIKIVGVPIAKIMQFAVSRERESLADVSAVNLTRDPQGMINALEALKGDSTPMQNPGATGAALYINKPIEKGGKVPFWAKMFDTHPPLDERIERLKKLQ